jgi:predicted TIM-barrel fold metal-dependent hydrolase
VVDAHVHIFPPELIEEREGYLTRDSRFGEIYCDPRARMATGEEVLLQMEQDGVDLSIVAGFPFADEGLCRAVNEYVAEQVHLHPGRLAGLACVAPGRTGSKRDLERSLDAGLRGCGELAPENWGAVAATRGGADGLDALVGCLRERGLPLLVHASEPVGHAYPGKGVFGPADCLALAGAYPGLKIVLAHMGGGLFLYETMPEVREALADVFYDTAAIPYLYGPKIYDVVLLSAGPQKLIFGSDYPLLSPGRYRAGLEKLAPEVRAAIGGGNAREVFGL